MLIALITLGLFIILISLFVNASNAKYLLAGYNSMTSEERQSYDLDGFLKSFKKVFLFLGIFIVVSSSFLHITSMEEYSIYIFIFFSITILISVFTLQKNFKSDYYEKSVGKIIFFIFLGLISIGLPIYIFVSALSDPVFIISDVSLKIEGSYDQEINYNDIKSIKLVNDLPRLIKRTGGSELGRKLKGHFLSDVGKVYLNVTLRNPPYLRIDTSYDIFFINNLDANIENIYKELLSKIETKPYNQIL